ncbi:MAG: hypothetical protein H0W84_06920 [Bacteroidetes bacterium]|nr:hypothetical protein [Bacteroidota bacterium]
MKTKSFIFFCTIAVGWGFTIIREPAQSSKVNRPRICINNFKSEVQEGTLINCRKIENMGVVVYLSQEMKTAYDYFQVELHRTGTDGDVMVAYRHFNPEDKEFKKKFADKDSLRLQMINPSDTDNSDFLTNTLKFKAQTYIIEHIVCMIHELEHVNFYMVVKGYKTTGKTDKFGVEVFDDGKEISERSISFRNWEKK